MTLAHPRHRPILALCLALLLGGAAACASAGSASSMSDPNKITAAELEASDQLDILTVIQRIRPRWLQARGSATFGGQVGATVLVNDMQQGGTGVLRNIRVVDVLEVEYLSASDATTRYGTNMAGGAILVTLKR